MRRASAIGAVSVVVVGAILVLPTLLDAYKLFEGQYDPMIDRSDQPSRSTEDDPRAPDAFQGPARGGEAPERSEADRGGSAMGGAERRFTAERALNTALTVDLSSAREQIARGFHGRLAADFRNHDDETALVAERLHRAADPDRGGPPSMVVRLGGEWATAASVDGPARSIAVDPPRPDGPDDIQTGRAGMAPALLPGSKRDSISITGLPDRQQVRVVLRYARGTRLARERAKVIGDSLRAQGLDVAEPADARRPVDDGRVTYWYRADLADAKRIAELASFPAPIRGRLASRGPLPRPGTVEIAVAN